MKVALIVALSANRVIGNQGQLPWHIPEDLKHFKKTTMGHTLIMGRKTYESIGRPLPGRKTVVISRTWSESPEGTELSHSLEEALELCQKRGDEVVFIAGGGQIYSEALAKELVSEMVLTQVDSEIEGDTYFPEVDFDQWRVLESIPGANSEKNLPTYRFLHLSKL